MSLSEFHRAAGSGRALCPDCGADCVLLVPRNDEVPRLVRGDVIIFLGQMPAKWFCKKKCGWETLGAVENLEMCDHGERGLHGATFIPIDELDDH